ncbi:hypothetical protein COCOR_06899 [Corallococcus coralloides DSM 2259]|uniref:DUF6603 domain-containing protein n=1 Tax=Corallococcus coralloides (strain ATCC 25202 / DSM 2259 / NBRC 100086 / M2) TaxID=1144275 RepID=H8N2A3_CORCM|nr:DUF6603 domain-containing protein [Corallococcus coralloides]AFE07208.1 hypothetical protein COCOR_06899 [Corallococcus coralloides DSM 2259]
MNTHSARSRSKARAFRGTSQAPSVTVSRASLPPVVATLAQLMGLLTPEGSDEDTLRVNEDWFGAPLEQTRTAVKQNGPQLAQLLGELFGEVGGNALGIPVDDPALLGTWFPISLPGSAQPSGLCFVSYEQDGKQVLGLGTLYVKPVQLTGEAVAIGPSTVDVEVWGMLPLVEVGGGDFGLVLGTEGFPLSLGFAVRSPGDPLIQAAGFSFSGVRVTATLDVAAANPVQVSTDILQLRLPGESAPKDQSLAQLASLSGDELLSTAAALAVSALGSVTEGNGALAYLLPALGLGSSVPGTNTQLPLLGWARLLQRAMEGKDLAEPFVTWFTALLSDADVLSAWLTSVASLVGGSALPVSGSGTRQDPFTVPLLRDSSLGTVSLTLASQVDSTGVLTMYPGLAYAGSPVVLGTSSSVLRIQGSLELGEFGLNLGGPASYDPSSLNGAVRIALVDKDPTQPLFQGQLEQLQYTFGALSAGVELAPGPRVVPHFELTNVQTPNGNYDVLDLTQPGKLVQVALDELVAAIVTELTSLLGVGSDPEAPFGSQLAALIGFTPPSLPEGVTWPSNLAPPLAAGQLLGTLQNPVAALGGYYAGLFQGSVGGQLPFYYLVSELGTLLQEASAPISITGAGTAVSPWKVSLSGASLPVSLVVFSQDVPGNKDMLRVTFGLEVAPALGLAGGPPVVLDFTLQAVSLDLPKQNVLAPARGTLLPQVGLTLSLPQGVSTPAVLDASVQVSSASLSVGWSPFEGLHWSMFAGQPVLMVGTTKLAVGEDLDFGDATSLEDLVTQQAKTFGPILLGLLGVGVARTGSPAGVAATGLLGLLPNLAPFMPQGLTWPSTMPTLQPGDLTDPIGALKAQVAGLLSSSDNARAAVTLLAWALQGGGGAPVVAGTGTYPDPFEVPLGFTSAIGGRLWYDSSAQSVGVGLGRTDTVSLGQGVQMTTDVRLDMVEAALGGQPLTGQDPVPSLTLMGRFSMESGEPLARREGVARVQALELGVRFSFSGGGHFTVTPLVDLLGSQTLDREVMDRFPLAALPDANPEDQEGYLTQLNLAIQAIVLVAKDAPGFQTVYTVLGALGLALVRRTDSDPYGVNPGGWQGLIANPLSFLGSRASAVLADPDLRSQFFQVLKDMLGIAPSGLTSTPAGAEGGNPLGVPTALLEVLAAMGYLGPAEQGHAPRPEALIELARHPVQTLTTRFQHLVTSPEVLAALISTLNAQGTIPSSFGIFTLSVTGGRVIAVGIPASAPLDLGSLVQLSGQLTFDLRQLTVGAAVRAYVPAIGAALVPEVAFSLPGTGEAASGSPLTLSLAWGDGTLPSARPLTLYPFDATTFLQDLAALAPFQALSTIVTQVVDSQLLARYPLAQVAFSALGLAFQDAKGAWHLKSLLGLFDDPIGWLISDAVLGRSGQLNLEQLSQVLKAIPTVASTNGISVSQVDGGISVSGLPYNLSIGVGVDLTGQSATFSTALTQPVSLASGQGSVEELSLAIRLAPNFQPGVSGLITVSGDVGLSNRLFTSFGHQAAGAPGFSLSVGEQGAGNPVLQLLPFQGWTSLVQQVASQAIQLLLETLTSLLLEALEKNGAEDFAGRLRTAGTELDVAGLVSALSNITDPDTLYASAHAWLIARVSAPNVQQTTQAIAGLFSKLVPGVSAQNGLITYTPGGAVPVTLMLGSMALNGVQQFGLWLKLDLPSTTLLQASVDQTGVGVDLASPGAPLFSFGVHLAVPIAGQTGPELDFVYDSRAQQLLLTLDPQGGGSSLARELYPSLFGNTGSQEPLSTQVRQWLLQVLAQVLPRYVSLVILNTSTVSQWLDSPLVQGGPTPGAVLVASQVLVKQEDTYELNTFEALSQLSPLGFLAGFLKALLSTQVKVLSFGTSGGIWLEPSPTEPQSFGVRVVAPDLAIPQVRNLLVQLGATDTAWIDQAGGPKTSPGLSVYVPIQDDGPVFGDLQLNLINLGLDIQGANQEPLIQLSRFQLGSVSPRALLTLDFDQGTPAVGFGAAVGLNEIAIAVAPTQAVGSGNAVAENLLGAGSTSQPSQDTEPVNPSFSVEAGYVQQLYVRLSGPDGGSQEQVWLPVQRNFGPLHVNQVGFGWRNTEKVLQLLFDGGVELAGLSAGVKELSVGIPVTTPTDSTQYSLDLQGLSVSYQGGDVSIGGGLLKEESPLRYDGAAIIKAGTFSIAALGSYALVPLDPQQKDGPTAPSLFVFAALDAPLGGIPEFFVTGLAAGFSYNRGLIIPEPGNIQEYPLVQAAMDPATFFGGDTQPENALSKLSTIVYPELGAYWVGAGVKFTTYELLTSFALLLVKFGREFEIDLVGASVMSLPPMVSESSALAYVEMGLVVSFKPSEGVISAFAQLTPNSFVLDRSAKLTGGFAFFIWYTGEHAGDFVITLGGYHPAFQRPAWYPDVPRLGLNWAISDSPKIGISGDAYFALTPSAVMVGAHMSLQFEDGPLRAWFNAGADFLLSWMPFSFDALIEISVGVALKTELFGVSTTLSASLGARLHMFGPPTGGIVEVDWYVISFSIPFGASQSEASSHPLQSWDDFASLLLPKEVGSTKSLSGPPRAEAGGGEQQVVKLRAAEGLLQDGPDGWLVKPFGFTLRVDTAIPATTLTVSGGARFTGPAMGVRPMDVPSITTPLTVTLSKRDESTGKWQPVALAPSAVSLQAAKTGAPEALWAQTFFDPGAAPSSRFIPDAVVGVSIIGDQMQQLDPIGPITLPDAFEFEQEGPLPLPYKGWPYTPPEPLPQTKGFQKLMSTLMAPGVVEVRNAVFLALREREVAASRAPSLDVLAAFADDILLAPPRLALIGEDVATGRPQGVRVSTRAVPMAVEAAPEPPAWGPRLLGGIRRYQVGVGRPSPDGVLLPWSRGSRGRWVDSRGGTEAHEALAAFTQQGPGAPRDTPCSTRVFPGSTTLWEVDPRSETVIHASGGLGMRVCSFDRNHMLLEDRRLEANSSWTLPGGTAHLALSGLDECACQPPLVGWQSDAPALKVNARYALAEGCVLRPQAALRERRRGGTPRRGTLDCAQVVAGNRVSDRHGRVEPGWLETLLPHGQRTVVVLAGPGPGLPCVSLAGKDTPEAPAARLELEPRSVQETEAGRVLFFDVPEAARSGRYLSVLVRHASPQQLRGVFGLTEDRDQAQVNWMGQVLKPLGVNTRARGSRTATATLVTRPR